MVSAPPRATADGFGESEHRHGLVGPLDVWRIKRAFQIDFLRAAGLMPADNFLDLGCGTLRGGIPLIDYLKRGRYVGVDVRKRALDEGEKELRAHGLEKKQPTLLHIADIRCLTLAQKFDCIWAFSTLIHMPDDILAHTLDFVEKHLAAGGVFYANVNIARMKEAAWREFPLVWRPFRFYRRLCAQSNLTVRDLGHLNDLGKAAAANTQRMLKITRR